MKRNIVFSIIILLLILIISQTVVATEYSDENSSAMQILLFTPRENSTNDDVTRFVFTLNRIGTCQIYTNYTNSWTKFGGEIFILDGNTRAQITEAEFTTEGMYRWNVFCKNATGGRSTWAQYEDRPFYIVPPPEIPIINNTNTTNQTPPQNNETNQSINTTEPPENNNTNTTNQSIYTTEPVSLNCSGCEHEGVCYEVEAKIMIDGKEVTCNSEGTFTKPMKNGEACSENTDCISNYCLNSICRIDWILTTILVAFGFY